MSVNVTVVGNLTRDPELRFTQSGLAVANTAVAVNERKPDGNGGWVDGETTFVNVTLWRTLGENAAASLHKGDRVVVTGKLQVRTYDREDGTKGTSVEVVADEIAASMKFATYEISKIHRSEPATVGAGAPVYTTEEEPF